MDLKERGMSKDTAAAVEETMMTSRDTAETIKETARQTAETAPQTSGTIRNATHVCLLVRTFLHPKDLLGCNYWDFVNRSLFTD